MTIRVVLLASVPYSYAWPLARVVNMCYDNFTCVVSQGAAQEAVSFNHQLIISGPLLFNTFSLSPVDPPVALHSEASPTHSH